MSKSIAAAVIALIVLLFLAYTSMFTVREGQAALVMRLGELQKNSAGKIQVYEPGLHFKWPIISQVLVFDMRLQPLNVDSSRILTAEQKYVIVDYFAKWRIENLPLYYKRTGGFPVRAKNLLTQKINDSLRAAFGIRQIKEVISGERLNVMQILKQRADTSAQGLGIKVVDVRIQAIDLPKEVQDSVFQRMRSEREQVATQFRSQGQAQAESIRANADADVAVTLATARLKSQQVHAAGDAQAAQIYSDAYNQNPNFYQFYRSLIAYRKVFDGNSKRTIMVLKPTSQFFKYFNKSNLDLANKKKS